MKATNLNIVSDDFNHAPVSQNGGGAFVHGTHPRKGSSDQPITK